VLLIVILSERSESKNPFVGKSPREAKDLAVDFECHPEEGFGPTKDLQSAPARQPAHTFSTKTRT
jgi:hypothetical protein